MQGTEAERNPFGGQDDSAGIVLAWRRLLAAGDGLMLRVQQSELLKRLYAYTAVTFFAGLTLFLAVVTVLAILNGNELGG